MILFHSENVSLFGLDRAFEIAKKTGFDGMEIHITNNLDTQNPEYLKRLEKRHDLPIKAFSLSQGYEEELIKAFQTTVREFPRKKIILASAGQFSNHYKEWLTRIAPQLAQKYELQYLRRNTPTQTMMGFLPSRVDNSLATLRQIAMVCLDLSALGTNNEDIMKALSVVGDRLGHLYVSNVYQGIPYGLPQKGILPLESCLRKVSGVFQGDYTLTLDGKILMQNDENTLVNQLKDGLNFVREYIESEK